MKSGRPMEEIGLEVHRIPYDGAAGSLPSKEAVGSKAHNLMRIAHRGLPVPPGFVLGTSVCRAFLRHGSEALLGLDRVVDRELVRLSERTGRHFGDARNPLLVSVRSGAAVSMPGMMETVLNIGLSDQTLHGLVRMTGNPRLAEDCRIRLIQQYGEVVHGIEPSSFRRAIIAELGEAATGRTEEMTSETLRATGACVMRAFEAAAGESFPDDPRIQLRKGIEAVLKSWSSERAHAYRKLNRIPHDLGTAVIVQAMVFGNRGPTSGSGVGFTRDPSDGRNELYLDYLFNAQGEDVVAGRRRALGEAELARRAPRAHAGLKLAVSALEEEFSDMQDFEFTVEEGEFHILQSRTGKRTPLAALRIAHDLVAAGTLSKSEALRRLDGIDLQAIETTSLSGDNSTVLARGTPASGGIVAGRAVFDPDRLKRLGASGGSLILLRPSAETHDLAGLVEADALVTAEGARTSHAAVVARSLGKVCVVGCGSLKIEDSLRAAHLSNEIVTEGDELTIDGGSGQIYRGRLKIKRERPAELLAAIEAWRGSATLA